MKSINRKGFTLIELLVVIAIIAILAVVVVLTLNPAQLLAQSRDSNRVSDFATLKSAIALYQADVSSTSMGTPGTVYGAYAGSLPTGTGNLGLSATNNTGWGYASGDATAVATSTLRGVGGTGSGWLPINFSVISSGAPFGSEPVDPLGTNANTSCQSGNAVCAYTYTANSSNQFKLAAHMESTKYMNGGANDVETSDGGNSIYVYEQGTNVNL